MGTHHTVDEGAPPIFEALRDAPERRSSDLLDWISE